MPWASASASKQEARYSCQIAVLKRDPASDSLRYHYGRLNLHFDDEILERASGPAASWRYRVPMEGNPERMVLAMDCIIPMSRETSEMMSQVVGHERRTDEARTIRPSIVPPGARSTITAAPPTIAANVIDGSVPNADGYICPPTYNWLSPDQQYCIDAGGNLSLPDVMVFEDPWPPGGGGDPGEEPCHLCDMRDDCDDPTELCFEDGHGGGFPPLPQDPCTSDNPPVYCTNPCTDARINAPAVQLRFETLFQKSNYDSASNYTGRLETIGVYAPGNPPQVYIASQYLHQTWDRAEALLPLSEFPPGSILLHVHPFHTDERFWSSISGRYIEYKPVPSPDDITAINMTHSDETKIFAEGIILDADQLIYFDHSGNVTDLIDRCGY